jgi:hypothetical protein
LTRCSTNTPTDLRERECADRTIDDVVAQRDRYFKDWKPIPISEITRTMARERHRRVSIKHGKAAANSALRVFKSAYNLALRVVDDIDSLPRDPVEAATYNRVCSANRDGETRRRRNRRRVEAVTKIISTRTLS